MNTQLKYDYEDLGSKEHTELYKEEPEDAYNKEKIKLQVEDYNLSTGDQENYMKEKSIVDKLLDQNSVSIFPYKVYSMSSNGKQVPFETLQKWEGYVTYVKKDSFIAKLVDLTNHIPDEEVEIGFEEIAKEDIELVEPGAVFYWNIGYHERHSGRERSSLIRFRRLPVWSQDEINSDKLRAKVKAIQNDLDWK